VVGVLLGLAEERRHVLIAHSVVDAVAFSTRLRQAAVAH
jgi:hypothetical protein